MLNDDEIVSLENTRLVFEVLLIIIAVSPENKNKLHKLTLGNRLKQFNKKY